MGARDELLAVQEERGVFGAYAKPGRMPDAVFVLRIAFQRRMAGLLAMRIEVRLDHLAVAHAEKPRGRVASGDIQHERRATVLLEALGNSHAIGDFARRRNDLGKIDGKSRAIVHFEDARDDLRTLDHDLRI